MKQFDWKIDENIFLLLLDISKDFNWLPYFVPLKWLSVFNLINSHKYQEALSVWALGLIHSFTAIGWGFHRRDDNYGWKWWN